MGAVAVSTIHWYLFAPVPQALVSLPAYRNYIHFDYITLDRMTRRRFMHFSCR